jgi:hypothetical protein
MSLRRKVRIREQGLDLKNERLELRDLKADWSAMMDFV